MDISILLNGKKAGLEAVRSAIFKARESGVVEVRSTWEGADVERLVQEAINEEWFYRSCLLKRFSYRKNCTSIQELIEYEVGGEYVKRNRVEWESEVEMPINLDGEPISAKKIRFEVLPAAIKLVLPENCPMISHDS